MSQEKKVTTTNKKKRCDMCGEHTELAQLQKSNLYSELEYCPICIIYAQQWEQKTKPRYEEIIKDAVKNGGGWKNDEYSYKL